MYIYIINYTYIFIMYVITMLLAMLLLYYPFCQQLPSHFGWIRMNTDLFDSTGYPENTQVLYASHV